MFVQFRDLANSSVLILLGTHPVPPQLSLVFYPSDMSNIGVFPEAEPLDIGRISQILGLLGTSWQQVRVLDTVDSTNNEIARHLQAITPGTPLIVLAEEQTSGLGRLGRSWSSQHGKGLALSLGLSIVDADLTPSSLPLVVGLAVTKVLSELAIPAQLKWPNDVVFLNEDGTVRKCGGILVQQTGDYFVIGIGVNITHLVSELPTEAATSLFVEGFLIDRNELAARIINKIEILLSDSTDWVDQYSEVCSSLGRAVEVVQISGDDISGTAVRVTGSGALVLLSDDGEVEITIGDVRHATID